MSNATELTTNPFGSGASIVRPLGGLVSVEQQRAIAEIQARMMMARANPRDPKTCVDMILNDCQRISLAEDACYQYSRGGSDVSGPSIRLAEAVARRWGNIAAGIKEISRGNGYSDVCAYAWDLETGYYDERLFQVKHWRDTKKGGYALEDERDIYELIANMGQRRKRAVLLSVIPGDVVDAAVRQCEITLKAKADTSPEGIAKIVAAFGDFGVTKAQIETRIQRRIDAIQPAQVVSLKRIYTSLRDGISVPEDWFQPEASATPADGAANASARDRLRAVASAKEQPAITDERSESGPPPEIQQQPQTQEAPRTEQRRRPPAAKQQAAEDATEGTAPPVNPPTPSMWDRFVGAIDRAESSADSETAYLILDEARSLTQEMADNNRERAAPILQAAAQNIAEKFAQ